MLGGTSVLIGKVCCVLLVDPGCVERGKKGFFYVIFEFFSFVPPNPFLQNPSFLLVLLLFLLSFLSRFHLSFFCSSTLLREHACLFYFALSVFLFSFMNVCFSLSNKLSKHPLVKPKLLVEFRL